ncbi:thiamine pyrophosphate-binding protein [Candidatus Gracilibacteria bacterium]|nr:thiamine pyrophosphate-binding protein [Candidatus Gracilibacteria bacterium]
MKKKLSDFIVDHIVDLGVKHVFMISGGGNMHLVNSFGSNEKIDYVCNHHEQACAISAEAYARVNENLGVCLVTTGPGATNTITGVVGAWLDSIPTLYISGQVKCADIGHTSGLRALGVQEVNTIGTIKDITKYSVMITRPEKIKYHLEKAIFLAKSGRPGPVWLDIPLDVQNAMVDIENLESFDYKKENLEIKPEGLFLSKNVSAVIEMVKKSERPIIIAGHGIRLALARKEFSELVDLLKIPVITAMSAHDLVTTDNNLFAGRHGSFGDRAGNFAVQNADLIITIGARNHLWNVGYQYELFARNAKNVVVDIDKDELSKKTLKPDLPILSDAKEFIKEMILQLKGDSVGNFSNWNTRCLNWRTKYPVLTDEYINQKEHVNSYYFTDVLSDLMKEGEQIVLANGTAFTGTLQAIKIKKDQRVHYNVGCASMGWCLPAAIGVFFAGKPERVILVTGDGSIMMNLQELQTIKHHNLPIKIFLLNNNGYLAIKNTQNSFFNGHVVAATPETGVSFPDFEGIANAFGLGYEKIENHNETEFKVKKVLDSSGPVLCEIFMDQNQTLYPKVSSLKREDGTILSKPLEDMFPFLDREEFLENMIIPPVNLE